MNLEDYERHTANLIAYAHDIEKSKRPGYTNDNEDVLHNFKRDALILGISVMACWAVHFLKQVFAIIRYTKRPDALGGESIDSRLADVINYSKLLYCIVRDGKESTDAKTTTR